MEQKYSQTEPFLLKHSNNKDEISIPIDQSVYVGSKNRDIFLNTMQKALPKEIWWHILSFLPPDDKALKFVLDLIELNKKQALALVKRYIMCTGGNASGFFAKLNLHKNVKQINKAWKLLETSRYHMKESALANKSEEIKSYFEYELNNIISRNQDRTLEQKEKIQELEYILYRAYYLHDVIEKYSQKNHCFYNSIRSSFCNVMGLMLVGTFLIAANTATMSLYQNDKAPCITHANTALYEPFTGLPRNAMKDLIRFDF
jgi:signal transduction histidine kinase